jgi:hypothetical protein
VPRHFKYKAHSDSKWMMVSVSSVGLGVVFVVFFFFVQQLSVYIVIECGHNSMNCIILYKINYLQVLICP